MLELKNIHTFYDKIEVLKGISIIIESGEIVCLIGANGAGKTTTLKTISGIIHPKEGEIIFEKENIEKLSPNLIVQKGICQVPEGRRIFPKLSVRENLEMGSFLRNDKDIENDIERVFSLFPVLKERLNQLGGTLSGGEQQMLAIGRALMSKPKLLLLDEPSMGLSPVLVEKIFQTILEINSKGTTIFLVEQNANLALHISNRGYVLETGKISLSDKSENLIKNDLVKKAYLGE